MDGTIIDSERIYHRSQIKALNDLGIKADPDLIAFYMSYGFKEHRQLFPDAIGVPDLDYDLMDQKMYEYYHEASKNGEVRLCQGTKQFLEYLVSNGIKTVLCTSTIRKTAEKELQNLGIYGYFDRLLCYEDVAEHKPSPEVYLKAASLYPFSSDETLVIEDAACGIRAAKAAGLRVALVPGIITFEQKWYDACDHIVPVLTDIIPIIEKEAGR